MPLMSLPTEMHVNIMLQLDHVSLMKFTTTNRYFRAISMAAPPKDIRESINEYLLSVYRDRYDHTHFPTSQDEWIMLYEFEQTNQSFLKRTNSIPCYGCFAIFPTSDFDYWAAKRLTEIDDKGMPLNGVCFTRNRDRFHTIFHLVMHHESLGRRMRNERHLSGGCQSFLDCVDDIEAEHAYNDFDELWDCMSGYVQPESGDNDSHANTHETEGLHSNEDEFRQADDDEISEPDWERIVAESDDTQEEGGDDKAL